MLRLGVKVRLGIAENSGGVSGPPRHKDLRLGGALRLGVHSFA